MNLRLEPCTHEQAKYAVISWHYSHALPTPPLVTYGVWEEQSFRGCIIFGRGSSSNLHKPYGVAITDAAELVRIALREHATPVSRIIRIAVMLLRRDNPKLRLLISFADPNQSHHGGIYQASGWIYTGQSHPSKEYYDKRGRRYHSRQVSSSGVKTQYGKKCIVPRPEDLDAVTLQGKHRYILPLDRGMREQIESMRKPYPKRRSVGNPEDLSGEGGASPTPALHS